MILEQIEELDLTELNRNLFKEPLIGNMKQQRISLKISAKFICSAAKESLMMNLSLKSDKKVIQEFQYTTVRKVENSFSVS